MNNNFKNSKKKSLISLKYMMVNPGLYISHLGEVVLSVRNSGYLDCTLTRIDANLVYIMRFDRDDDKWSFRQWHVYKGKVTLKN